MRQSAGQRFSLQVAFSPRDEYLAVGSDGRRLGAAAGPAYAGGDRAQARGAGGGADPRDRPRLQRGRPVSRGGHAAHALRYRSRRIDDPSFVLVWDLRSPDRPPDVVRTFAGSQALALSPDGRTVYTAFPLTAYDVATGRRSGRPSTTRSWCSTSARMAGCSPPRSTRRILGSRSHPADRCTHRKDPADPGWSQDRPRDLRFSEDGSRLASVSHDGQLIVWEVSTGEPLWSRTCSRWGGASTSARRAPGLHRWRRRDACVPGTCTGTSSSCAGCSRGQAGRTSSTSSFARRHAVGLPVVRQSGSVTFLDTVTGKGARESHGEIFCPPGRRGPGTPMAGIFALGDDAGLVTVFDAQTGSSLHADGCSTTPTSPRWPMSTRANG